MTDHLAAAARAYRLAVKTFKTATAEQSAAHEASKLATAKMYDARRQMLAAQRHLDAHAAAGESNVRPIGPMTDAAGASGAAE